MQAGNQEGNQSNFILLFAWLEAKGIAKEMLSRNFINFELTFLIKDVENVDEIVKKGTQKQKLHKKEIRFFRN